MSFTQFTFTASDKHKINVYRWMPTEGFYKGAVQFVHGMMDHAGRFNSFAERLTKIGLVVYAIDNRGSGKTITAESERNHWPRKNGWERVVKDQKSLNKIIQGECPELPIILWGSSMGSFIAQAYAAKYSKSFSGLVLSGCFFQGGTNNKITLIGARLLARLYCLIGKENELNPFIHNLVFEKYNERVENPVSDYDWLSSDKAVVDSYIKDVNAGGVSTTGLYYNLFDLVLYISTDSNIKRIRKEIPVLFLGGEDDVLSNNGEFFHKLVDFYKKNDFEKITDKIYKGVRHEVHNDVSANQVFEDIYNWIKVNFAHLFDQTAPEN